MAFSVNIFYTSAVHVSLAENLGLCHPKKVTEFGFGGDAISRCFEGLILAFFSLFIVDILTCSQFLLHPTPPLIFVCKFGQITRPIFPKSGGTYPRPLHPVAPPVNVLHSPHQSAYTASITPLKQPYCISMIISSMPSDHRRCHAMSLPFSRFRPNNPPFILIWNSIMLCPWFKSHPFRLIYDFSSEHFFFWCQSLHLYSLFYNCTLNILNRVLLQSSAVSDTQPIPSYILMKRI